MAFSPRGPGRRWSLEWALDDNDSSVLVPLLPHLAPTRAKLDPESEQCGIVAGQRLKVRPASPPVTGEQI